MMDCFLYSAERQTLFELVEHYIPKFPTLSKEIPNSFAQNANVPAHIKTDLSKDFSTSLSTSLSSSPAS